MERKETGKNIVIIVLTIIIALLIGYITMGLIQDKEINQEDNSNKEEVTVITGIDYSYIASEFNSHKGDMEKYPINLKIPQITSDEKSAKEINDQIIVNTILATANHHEFFIDIMEETGWEDYEGTITTYDYEIKNNVIAISIKTIDKDGSSEWPGSGSGEVETNYFYDTKNDKELTLVEALPLMGYTTADLKKFNLTTFEGLTENDSSAYYRITNGKGEIIFYDCREGCI